MSLVPQQTQSWCWAATTSEVLNYYRYPNYQCELVTLALARGVDCCFFPQFCNVPGTTTQMEQLIYYVSNGQLYGSFANGPLAFEQIVAQISSGRPIIIYYGGSFVGHFVVLYGYDRASGEVFIHDPFFGPFTVPYGTSFFYNATQPLYWTHTMLMNR